MAPTPASKSNHSTPSSKFAAPNFTKTPQSKHRLNFTAAGAAAMPLEHPVEVVGRIRDHPDQKLKPSALQSNTDGKSLRMKTEIGYRDFTLDGVSLSEDDDLDEFYKKFVESRINGVKLGNKCTIMMYGPTGSGKSHTMFGCPKQPGIVYKSLKDILGDGVEEDGEKVCGGTFVQVTVLEIYNEEIYDLLSPANAGGGFSFGWSKSGAASKVRLEVMGKKAKNATFISGNEASKMLKEIQKVEKRRIVKSTLCNERSSRSHCMIILDVPTVGGQLMLVDMAGSENIEQAGQLGFEAKMQTAKINQGNIALKRVVESIANGDSHVPFRDSKLTMLLQDSFEDNKSKILMILCASPDPKEMHKTIATLEYGAKAKCIIRGPHTPIKDNKYADDSSSSALILGSRISALDEFIHKLQAENKLKEKELKRKEEEVSALRDKLAAVEKRGIEEEINSKVNERTQMLKNELEKKAQEIVEIERRKMEEKILQQQLEVELLRRRLEEVETELQYSRSENSSSGEAENGGNFMKRLMEVYSEDSDMVKSMDLDKSYDLETTNLIVPKPDVSYNFISPIKACLTTVYEEEENEKDDDDDEEDKEVIEDKTIIFTPEVSLQNLEKSENPVDETASRQKRIENIFTLCGNKRELSNHIGATPTKLENEQTEMTENLKENSGSSVDVFVKWEAAKENESNLITTLRVLKDSTSLADLRKLIEIHLGADNQDFTFLALGDLSGAPLCKEDEGTTEIINLPICKSGYLTCLRPLTKPIHQRTPFSPLENTISVTPNTHLATKKGDDFSPNMGQHLSSTPFITLHRY